MFRNLAADLRHYSRFCCHGKPIWRILARILYSHPGSAGVIWFRFGSFAWHARVPGLRQLLQAVYLLGMPLIRLYSGVQIQPQTKIGPGLAILHFGGVVITRDCTIGENCLLYHNVNIVTMKNKRGPTIGTNFYAGVGATIIGTLIIDDYVTAGAGCVITKSVPGGAVVAGVPARILRFRNKNENSAENKTSRNHPAEWLQPPEQDVDLGMDGLGVLEEQ